MKKIILCGLEHERNLGDSVIMAAVESLFKDAASELGDCQIETIDLYGRTGPQTLWGEKQLNFVIKTAHRALGLLRRLCSHVNRPLGNRIAYFRWRIDPNGMKRSYRYFREKLRGASLVVIAGGGVIGYSARDFHLQLKAVISVSESMGIPVVLNAVGIAGDEVEPNDHRFKMLREALNSEAVKLITVRDGINTMNGQYLTKGRLATRTADPGVWIADILGMKKQEEAELIGLGMIRSNAFSDYGIDLKEEDLISFWVDVVNELDRRNLPWMLFCNGYEKDYALGLKVLERLGIADVHGKLADRPVDYRELLTIIRTFRAVICHRLHACIISYSFNIPFVALSWNKKLEHFMETIGYPDRVFDHGQFHAAAIVDAMLKAAEEGFDHEFRERYMGTIKDSVILALQQAK